eukprot:scaffold396811_cov33-Prasinocladus_malaysianus.AAC.1
MRQPALGTQTLRPLAFMCIFIFKPGDKKRHCHAKCIRQSGDRLFASAIATTNLKTFTFYCLHCQVWTLNGYGPHQGLTGTIPMHA